VIERVGRVDESSHSSGLSTVGNRLRDFGKRNVLGEKVPMHCLDEQEAEGGHILRDSD
jgi:hypothetical protein